MDDDQKRTTEEQKGEERREFLRKAGRFAMVTPPIITMMLSVSEKAQAQPFPSGTA